MKWILASERLPEGTTGIRVVRYIDTGKTFIFNLERNFKVQIDFDGYHYKKEMIEWLDESPCTEREGWVSVDDGLPEDGQIIDTWNGKSNRRSVYRKLATPEQSLFERYTNPHQNERVYVTHFPDVTHWLPLPQPPVTSKPDTIPHQ